MASWSPIDGAPRSVRTVQALTETPPGPLDTAEGIGLVLDEVGVISFYLDAGDGYTLTSEAGSVDIHVHDAGLWAFCPELSLSVPLGSAGKRRVLLGTRATPQARGRLAMFANGIQAGNTVVAIDAIASDKGGRK